MWRNSVRDLMWRRRRFIVAIVGTSLVFAMSLLLSGLSNAFRAEVHATVDTVGADAWVVRSGGGGPLASVNYLPAADLGEIAHLPAVREAEPMIFVPAAITRPHATEGNIVGFEPGALGTPRDVTGRSDLRPGEAIADVSAGAPIGGTVTVQGHTFRVVGTVRGMTLIGGNPDVFVRLEDAQATMIFGAPLVSTFATRGVPTKVPHGFQAMSPDEAALDGLRPLSKAVRTIDFTRSVLWVVAALIVGVVIYLSALERTRDFAVMKATGVSTRHIFGGLALQSVVVSVVAAVLALGVAKLLTPLFPMRLVMPVNAYPLLFAIAVVVGLLASGFGIRRAATVQPALAFAGP